MRMLTMMVVLLATSASAQEWRLTQTATAPSPREGHAMAYDAGRGCTVLFGGYEWVANQNFQDHWEFDGDTWTRRALARAPSPRTRAGMCYDEARGVLVLFGGYRRAAVFGSPTYFGDTWEFDGLSWRQIATPAAPSPRLAELAYDPIRQRVVLFGGTGNTAPLTHNDLWEYDGAQWTQRTVAGPVPPARPDYTIAFDRRRGRLVAHPGYVYGHSAIMDTWEWDGASWSQSANATRPPAFPQPKMIYDTERETVVLVGAPFHLEVETWEFDGTDWRRNGEVSVPSRSLAGHALTYDAGRGAAVLFGGDRVFGTVLVAGDDTWQLARFAEFSSYGSACAAVGSLPGLSASSGPSSGETFRVDVDGLSANASPFMMFGNSSRRWLGVTLPLDLAPLGLPGCELLTSVEFVFPLTVVGGGASWAFAVPGGAELHGTPFYVQALVADGAMQPIAVSNGGAAVVGL